MTKREILPKNRNLKALLDFVPPPDIPIEQLWTSDAVRGRLVEAAKLIERTGGRVAPKGYGTTMPEYSYDWGDLLAQTEGATLLKGRNMIRIGASSQAMTRAEEAMVWPMRYLEEADGPRRALRLFLRCRAKRERFGLACKKKGWSRVTAWRARDRALTIIAIGLIRDRVPLVLAHDDDDESYEPAEAAE